MQETTVVGDPSEGAGAAIPSRPIGPGTRIGRYLVIDRLGAGGMGVVYAAYDGKLDRKIALKLIRDDRRTANATAPERLLREAQAMAKVDHPNVITVHDVGTHDGQVFVAMEFVVGTTLRGWLKESERSWRAIVPLFRQAALGLAAAHRAGLVHRDIKPDNIMVSQDGRRVRVMDFGLVRAAQAPAPEGGPAERELLATLREPQSANRERRADELAEAATIDASGGSDPSGGSADDLADVRTPASELDLTRTGAVLGTPAYMAPEQLGKARVDGAADQFALSVCLFEALYGQRPFDAETFAELAGNILCGEIKAPMSRTIPRWLRAVVLRGLQVEPANRFPDLEAFAGALRRGRSRRSVITLAAAGSIGTVLVVAAATDRDAACTGAQTELSQAWTASRHAAVGSAVAALDLSFAAREWASVGPEIEGYAQRWARMYTANCEATAIRREQSEALMDLRRRCLYRARAGLDAVMEILAVPDAAILEGASDLVDGLPALDRCGPDRALQLQMHEPEPSQVAEVEAIEQEIARASALLDAAKYDAAAVVLREATDRIDALGYEPVQTEALLVQAELDATLGRHEAAASSLRDAMANAARWGQWEGLSEASTRLLHAYGYELARYPEAELMAELALGLARQRESRIDEAAVYYEQGGVLAQRGLFEQARAQLESALEIREREYGPLHRQTVIARYALAELDYRVGDYDAAERTYREVLELEKEAFGPEHPMTSRTHDALGSILYARGEYQGAEAMHRQALDQMIASLGPDHPGVATMRTHLGLALGALGRHDEAEEQERAALAVRKATLPPDHPDIAQSHNNLAVSLIDQERYEEAAAEYRKALEILSGLWGDEHPHVVTAELGLGAALHEAGRTREALVHLEHVWAVRKDSAPPERRAAAAFRLARALAPDPAQRERAKALAQAAIDAYREAGPGYDRPRAIAEAFLANAPP